MIVKVDVRDRLVQDAIVEKFCKKCGEVKPRSDFTIDNSSKDGLSYYCRGCNSRIDKARRDAKKAAAAAAALNGSAELTIEETASLWRKAHPPTPADEERRSQQRKKSRTEEVLTMVSMILEMPREDAEAVVRMVSAFYVKEGVQP